MNSNDNINIDFEGEQEYLAVHNTLRIARQEGLEIEVILSVMNSLKGDPTISISQACSEGLYDWDC